MYCPQLTIRPDDFTTSATLHKRILDCIQAKNEKNSGERCPWYTSEMPNGYYAVKKVVHYSLENFDSIGYFDLRLTEHNIHVKFKPYNRLLPIDNNLIATVLFRFCYFLRNNVKGVRKNLMPIFGIHNIIPAYAQ